MAILSVLFDSADVAGIKDNASMSAYSFSKQERAFNARPSCSPVVLKAKSLYSKKVPGYIYVHECVRMNAEVLNIELFTQLYARLGRELRCHGNETLNISWDRGLAVIPNLSQPAPGPRDPCPGQMKTNDWDAPKKTSNLLLLHPDPREKFYARKVKLPNKLSCFGDPISGKQILPAEEGCIAQQNSGCQDILPPVVGVQVTLS
jgi:hypothetical protein